ncbi:MAG: branched-chain amino acid ABC transporter permease [Burkholderiaceae bacterium]
MQLAVNIVVLAAIYALISCGYVLIYRVSRVLSLAHGELMMVGAYLLLTTASLFRDRPLVAIAAAAFLAVAVGVLVYVLLMRKMTGEMVLAAVLSTIALGIALRGAMILFFTSQQQYPLEALSLSNAPITLVGDARISTIAALLVGITALVYLGLWLFLRHSAYGIRMRAAGQNPLLAAQRGIGLHGMFALAWALATFTGGIAGMLIATDSGLDATMATIGLKAFPAALVGGLDSLLGAVLGSLTVAAAEVLLIHYVDPLLADVVPFLVLTAMLIVRPWGFFGSREELDRV